MKECPKELIDAHWGYVAGVITATLSPFGETAETINLSEQEYHYRAAFAHGWKHAKEDNGKKIVKSCSNCSYNAFGKCLYGNTCNEDDIIHWSACK